MLTYLAAGITKEGKIDTAPIDRLGISIELKKYKDEFGGANFRELINIPVENRIPAMAEKDMRGTVTTLAVAITMSQEAMNLKRPMTAIQIVDLAEAIVDDAGGDKLSFEDALLFLQKLVRGEYGGLYESLDSIKFMDLFSKYRDERWQAGIKIRDEKDEYYKNLGPSRDNKKMTAFDSMLSEYATKIQAKNDEIKELKEERKRNWNTGNF